MTDDLHYPVSDDVHLAPVMTAFIKCRLDLDARVLADFEALGVEPHEFDVLVTLGDTCGKTFKTMSEQLVVSCPSTTRLLARMEAKGLVRWVKGERDARQKIVSLTPLGQARYEEVFLPHIRAVRRRIDALSAAEQAELVRLLDKLRRAFATEEGA